MTQFPHSRSDGMYQRQCCQSRSDGMYQPRTQVLGTRATVPPKSQRDDRFRGPLTFLSSRCDLHSPETAYLGLASQAIACRRFATKCKHRLITQMNGCN